MPPSTARTRTTTSTAASISRRWCARRLSNVSAGSIQSGASTIAMQVVRNVEVQDALQLKTTAEQQAAYKAATSDTIARKLKEMTLAIGLEKTYSKRQVLLAYLNIANFGMANYGVEAAAQAYFSTTAADVTPAQAASIIAIVQSPTARNLGNSEELCGERGAPQLHPRADVRRRRHHEGSAEGRARHQGGRELRAPVHRRGQLPRGRGSVPLDVRLRRSRRSQRHRARQPRRRSARPTGSSAATTSTRR